MSVYRSKYKVVRTCEEPVELVNGLQSGTYQVEHWTSQDRGKTFLYTDIVKDNLSFEEATELKKHSYGSPASYQQKMTWVIGTATPFGYAVGLSDIRITFPDGSERDCLQKIHGVGRLIAAGFAGSVSIGLTMIDQLRNSLNPIPQGKVWIPSFVAEQWQFAAQQIFYAGSRLRPEPRM